MGVQMKKLSVGLICAFVALSIGAAHSAPIFEEYFTDEASSLITGVTGNFTGFNQFAVTDGTVDFVKGAGGGVSCVDSISGGCVDLDGSTTNAGVMTSTAISFATGFDYTLSLVLAGSMRNSTSPTDTVLIEILNGVLGPQSVTKAASEGFATYSYTFTVASNTSGSIRIENSGSIFGQPGDNGGLILDSVVLTGVASTAVPLPASLPLLAAGIGVLGFVGRRKKAATS